MKFVVAAFAAWISVFAIFSGATRAAEAAKATAAETLAEACRRTAEGLASITSGYCEMEISTSVLNCAEADVQKEIDARTKSAREALEKEKDDQEKAVLEDRIKRLTAAVRDRIKSDRQQLKVVFSDKTADGVKLRAESLQKNDKTGKWETTAVWLEKQDSKGDQGALTWRPQSKLAYLRSWSGFDEEIDFTAFGRMQGDPASEMSMTYGDGVTWKIVGRKTYDKSATAAVVEAQTGQGAKAKTLQRYWIDSIRYVCPVVQFYANDGTLQSEWKSSDYFQNEKSGLWFPGKTVRTTMSSGFANSQRTTWQINPTALRINEKEKNADFVLTLPMRTRIADYRSKARTAQAASGASNEKPQSAKQAGAPRYYVADAALTLSLAPDGLDLSKKKGLQVVENVSRLIPPKRAPAALVASRRWIFFAAIGTVVAVACFTAFRLNRSRRQPSPEPQTEPEVAT